MVVVNNHEQTAQASGMGRLFLLAAATPSWAEIVDRVIAVVNDDVITQYELENTVELVLKRYGPDIPPGDRERIAGEARKVFLEQDDRRSAPEAGSEKAGDYRPR